jgi:hypothetical protein
LIGLGDEGIKKPCDLGTSPFGGYNQRKHHLERGGKEIASIRAICNR